MLYSIMNSIERLERPFLKFFDFTVKQSNVVTMIMFFNPQIRPRLTYLKAIIFYSKIFTNQEEGVIEVGRYE